MGEGIFETPNTRSRRRREDDASSGSKQMGSQEDERVVWVHDQRLRRAVLSATEHVELAPPTPTQRPRPLSSSRTTGSSSSRPPRKRPCRNSRSEPNGSGSTAKNGSSSSMPNASEGEVKLDVLLQRFELLSTPLAPSRAMRTSLSSATARNTNTSVLCEKEAGNTNTLIPMTPDMSSPVTRSTTSGSLVKQPFNTIVNNAPVDSPLKARAASSVPGRYAQKGIPTGHQKPFKPPLLNPPTRSSPRLPRTNNTIPPSPLRASIAAPAPSWNGIITSTARPPPPASIQVTETPCRGKVRKHNANVDVGEDDPAGDSSFDSFDGLFQDGGPEIEELLKTVDGSQ